MSDEETRLVARAELTGGRSIEVYKDTSKFGEDGYTFAMRNGAVLSKILASEEAIITAWELFCALKEEEGKNDPT